MKQFKYIAIICFLFSYGTLFSQTTWHVKTNGSDTSGIGSSSNPFASLDHVANQVQPGDTVYVHEGTYRNDDFGDGDIWEGDNLAKITANGSEGNYITFSPFPGDNVTLEFDSTYGVLILNSSYINFSGFDVKGIADQISQTEADNAWGLYKDDVGVVHDLAIELGIDINDPNLAGTEVPKPSTPGIDKPKYHNGRGIVANGSHHIIISNNIVRDVPSSAIRCQQSDYVTISGNTVYNNTYWTTQGVGAITVAEATPTPSGDISNDVKIIIEKNYVHHNENRLISWNPSKTFVKMVIDEGTGLFLTRNRDTYTNGYILIANNISEYNGASGIVSHFTDRVIVEHNTLYKNGTTNDSAAGGIGINNTDDVIIRNNISYAEPDHWALGTLANPNTNLSIYNNLLYNENGSEAIHNNLSSGWTQSNPLFTDDSNSDFTLTEFSPAIDSGSTLGTQTDDIVGTLRNDSTPDIGAYEYSISLSTIDYETTNIKVFPNPAYENLYITSDNRNIVSVIINNVLGKQVMSNENLNNTSSIISLKDLQRGLYFVKIKTKHNFKIIVLIKK